MKRDMDLVRTILFVMEDGPALAPDDLDIEGYDGETVSYHLAIMGEAGLLIVLDTSTLSEFSVLPLRMTWAGHEFLEAVRDDNRWNQVKGQMGKVGGFVVDVAKTIASTMMLRQLGLG